MKKLLLTVFLIGAAWTAQALERGGLELRAQKLIAQFQQMQAKPDKQVPPDMLRKAHGIILLDRTKAGFLFAYQGGGGIALVKDKKGRWSPLAFMKADEASLGFQIGGQQSFFVILLLNDATTKTLTADAAFELGGEARGTAGESTAGVEGKVDYVERAVAVYGDRQGLFGGVAFKGGAISPDHKANGAYYGGAFSMQEILLDRKLTPTAPAVDLARRINGFCRAK
jgi:lipid-binding SYLF domain-containing protein